MKRRDHETSSIPPNADAIDVGADLRRKLVELRSGEFSVAAPDRLQPGDLVAERYAIVRHLGRGAFCEVFEASDRENDGAACAIKVPRAEGKSSEELITRFRVEVRAASLIDSPHAASAFDAGLLDDGRPFYAMEFLRGLSLAGLLVRDDRVHPAHVAMIGIDILHALHEAHTRGIIHRDIKPSNALVVRHPRRPRPYARVIDFGIAKVLDSGDFNASMMNLTGDGRSPCTPLYAAPEQMRGSVTPKSDLYSLAMLLAALIEGYAPYGEHRGAMLISRQLDGGEVPWGPRTMESPLADIIAIAGQKSPDRRFDSALAMRRALLSVRERLRDEPEPPELYLPDDDLDFEGVGTTDGGDVTLL